MHADPEFRGGIREILGTIHTAGYALQRVHEFPAAGFIGINNILE